MKTTEPQNHKANKVSKELEENTNIMQTRWVAKLALSSKKARDFITMIILSMAIVLKTPKGIDIQLVEGTKEKNMMIMVNIRAVQGSATLL